MKIMLKDVRLAFPSLWVARSMASGEGEPKFSASFLMAPDHPAIAEIRTAILAVANEKWGAKANDMLKSLNAGGKICLHDGDAKSEYAGFPGNKYVQASNKIKPTVLDSNKSPLDQSSGRPYAGCYVNAQIDVWAQDNSWGKRINASLMGVQFWREGEPFAGGGVASASDFDAAPPSTSGAKTDDMPF